MPKSREAFVFTTVLLTVAPCWAQGTRTIKPSGKDPVDVACPGALKNGSGIDQYQAWKKGDELLHSEGGGAFMLNFGASEEAIQWFCKASAAGSSIAPYTIGEIYGRGFMRQVGRVTENHLRDAATSFYWHKLSADRGFTRGMLAVAQWYGAGIPGPKGFLLPPNKAEAQNWLLKAAAAGDTEALLILFQLYSGMPVNPWSYFVSVPRDDEKARIVKDKGLAILKNNASVCTDHKLQMIAQLPDPRRGITGDLSLVQVHGTAEPFQIVCQIKLEKQKQSDNDDQRERSTFGQVAKGLTGVPLDYWQYTITKMPDGQAIVTRQIVAEAMGLNAEQKMMEYEKYLPAPGKR
jgi:hypothetical protein